MQEVAQLLLANRISGAPVVVSSGKLVGIITEGDLLRRIPSGSWPKAWGPPPRTGWVRWLLDLSWDADDLEYVSQHGRTVADIMTREIISAQPDALVSDVATLLVHHQIKRVPVVRDRKLVGLISRANLVQALAGLPKIVSAGEPAS